MEFNRNMESEMPVDRWTNQSWIVHYIVITYLQYIGLTVRYITNMVLRTSVSFTEDCPVASVDPVIVDDHLRVNQAVKAWSPETETSVTSE